MLFGGGFDPPHLGHQTMVANILKSQLTDQVWYVPSAKHPFNKSLTDSEHRLKMLSYILVPQTKIELYEINKPGIGYSYETLKHFSQMQTQNIFSWLIGSDQLASFDKWKDYQQLLSEFKVYVYPRTDFPLKPLYAGMIPLTDFEEITVASNKIRQLVKDGQSITGLVDKQVEAYILQNRLYT